MGDGLFELSEPDRAVAPLHEPMSQSQREAIRALFGQLGVSDARSQFAVVNELTGKSINSVADLDQATAQTLIKLLPGKIANAGKARTGNSWDDREEPTWIDQL